MMPLSTPTTSDSTVPEPLPVQLPETCGWALTILGSPWVAHLVCPIPHVPFNAFPPSVLSERLDSLPFAFTTSDGALPFLTARPAES